MLVKRLILSKETLHRLEDREAPFLAGVLGGAQVPSRAAVDTSCKTRPTTSGESGQGFF